MIEVALFPIPESVNFPGVPVPLHVFEPRYRKMVRYCIDNDVMMGVCHIQGIVRNMTQMQTRDEALNSNQSTYKPCDVFSAGKVELQEELDDGRMAVIVHLEKRLELKQVQQQLPFYIWACEPFEDEPIEDGDLIKLRQSHEKLMQRLLVLGHGNDEFQKMLASDKWQNLSAVEFSFMVNGLFDMPAKIKQEILEMRLPQQRLDALLKLLNAIEQNF